MNISTKRPSQWPAVVAALVRAARVALGLAVLACAVLTIIHGHQVRVWEAWAAAPFADLVTAGKAGAVPGHDILYCGQGTVDGFGMRITPECTVGILMLPVLIAGGLLLIFSRAGATRVIVATAVGLAAVILVNQVRLALIAFATQRWGVHHGYEVAHKSAGSLLALVGFALSFLTVIKILGLRTR